MNNKICIIGGAGYVGSKLTLDLLIDNFEVIVIDNFTYGNPFPFNHENLTLIQADVRNVSDFLKHIDNSKAIIHLACVSNDPSFDLDPEFGKSVNLDCFPILLNGIKNLNIEKFIYASSSSVYGIKEEDNVTENLKLEPLTDYSRFKVECEKILMSTNLNGISKTILRPATVCGPSLRQRLDVVVNIFTYQAYFNKKLNIFGGSQLRPNIHINDMCRSYASIIKADIQTINGKIYNVGFENISVENIANLVISNITHEVEVTIKETNDPRSYKINSDKFINELSFKPMYSIDQSIKDLIKAFDLGHCKDALTNPIYKNIEVLKNNQKKI